MRPLVLALTLACAPTSSKPADTAAPSGDSDTAPIVDDSDTAPIVDDSDSGTFDWVAPSTADGALATLPAADLTQDGAPAGWLAASTLLLMQQAESFGITDPACPMVDRSTYTGGCTDSAGTRWWGVMDWDAEWGGSTEGFGHDRADACWEIRVGTVDIEGSAGGSSHRLNLAVWTVCDGENAAFWVVNGRSGRAYDETVDGWPWSSTLTYGTTALGVASVREDGAYRAVCALEPDLGTLTVTSGAHVLVYTYDGAVACDGLVPVTLDGVEIEPAAFPG